MWVNTIWNRKSSLSKFTRCETVWFPGVNGGVLKSCSAKWTTHCLPRSTACSSKLFLAVAWISFNFPEFLCHFLTESPQWQMGWLLQIIPGNPVNLRSQLLKSYWVEMSKWGQLPSMSGDTCFLASYYCKSIERVLGLRWPGMHLSTERSKDWSSGLMLEAILFSDALLESFYGNQMFLYWEKLMSFSPS